MNIIDLILVLFLGYFLVIGYLKGAIRQSFDLLALIVALFFSFLFYKPLGSLLASGFKSIPVVIGNAIGFFAVWAVVELLFYFIFVLFYYKIPDEVRESNKNRWLGLIPAVLKATLSAWVLLGLFLILPIPGSWRTTINNSLIAGRLAKASPLVEHYVGSIFGSTIDDTIKEFLTVKPDSTETIDLGFSTAAVEVDPASEQRMLELINQERTKLGLVPLVMDDNLQSIARAHSRDMFSRGYFSHNTPEGLTPFNRMEEAGIKYTSAGENLALAPNVDVAHTGLMNSPGHRANILAPEYRKVGIGVIDGGKYGKMFNQEFTD